jgi:nucleotide-binding universal stress UspA family protein
VRVLLAIDGSDCSKTATDLVATLPWTPGTTVRVMRAVEPFHRELGAWELMATYGNEQDERDAVAAAEADVEATAARLREIGIRTEHFVARDRAASAIIADAERRRPDLVVVGSHGYSALDRALLGSVSAEVVDHSPVPVLVARRATLGHALIAVDGSDIALDAVDTVGRWPLLAMARNTVLSVIPVSAAWWRSIAVGDLTAAEARSSASTASVVGSYERFAQEAATRIGAVGIGSSVIVRSGAPAAEVLECAREVDADLIVLGSHGRTGLSRLVLGSVARSVLNRAPCSVLIVRRHQETARIAEVSHVLAAGLVPA